MQRISDILDAMVSHIHAAEKLISEGDASTFVLLRPIRLQMASSATSCFVACQHAIDQHGPVNGNFYLVRDGWKHLAGKMRAIAAVYQSPEHPAWSEYVVEARHLMADFKSHIAITRQLIDAAAYKGPSQESVR